MEFLYIDAFGLLRQIYIPDALIIKEVLVAIEGRLISAL